MYCDRCNRAVVAIPGALPHGDRSGLPGALTGLLGRLRGPRNLPEWRCPECLGPVHEGDEPLASGKKALAHRAWALSELLGLFGGIGLLVKLARSGPDAWLVAIGIGAAAVLFVALVRRADERFEPRKDLSRASGGGAR